MSFRHKLGVIIIIVIIIINFFSVRQAKSKKVTRHRWRNAARLKQFDL